MITYWVSSYCRRFLAVFFWSSIVCPFQYFVWVFWFFSFSGIPWISSSPGASATVDLTWTTQCCYRDCGCNRLHMYWWSQHSILRWVVSCAARVWKTQMNPTGRSDYVCPTMEIHHRCIWRGTIMSGAWFMGRKCGVRRRRPQLRFEPKNLQWQNCVQLGINQTLTCTLTYIVSIEFFKEHERYATTSHIIPPPPATPLQLSSNQQRERGVLCRQMSEKKRATMAQKISVKNRILRCCAGCL